MRREEVVQIVNNLDFDRGEFWVVAGSAMCLYGLRHETNDVDLGCTSRLADELERKGYKAAYFKDGTRSFAYNDEIEVFENFLFDKVEEIDGIPVISLQGLIEMKLFIGREKDIKDIKLIEQYLLQKEEPA